VNKNGAPKALLANAITALRMAPEWAAVLGFNEFSLSTVALKPPPFGGKAGAEWSDHEDRLTADWLQHQGIQVGVEVAGQATQTVAMERKFHPVRAYLESLKWDGTERIGTWLSLYLGADSSDYTKAVGSRWLISAIARVLRPGCKADCSLILEGPQGIYKSTVLQKLGGEWFTDQIAELHSKDASMATMGKWIIELSELDALTRADAGRIKAFMSRTTEHFRPPYGKRTIDAPRQCVFAGTVNHSEYLKDETGGRRFWPVVCTRILIDDLSRDRDQLWAEALVQYRAGANWYLDTVDLVAEAQAQQEERYEADVWDSKVMDWADDRVASGCDSVSIAEALEMCLEKKLDTWTKADQMRVGRCLRAAKWERFRDRKRGMEWRYKPPVPTSGGNTGRGGNTVCI
jgi:predicted P-loop ATPase